MRRVRKNFRCPPSLTRRILMCCGVSTVADAARQEKFQVSNVADAARQKKIWVSTVVDAARQEKFQVSNVVDAARQEKCQVSNVVDAARETSWQPSKWPMTERIIKKIFANSAETRSLIQEIANLETASKRVSPLAV